MGTKMDYHMALFINITLTTSSARLDTYFNRISPDLSKICLCWLFFINSLLYLQQHLQIAQSSFFCMISFPNKESVVDFYFILWECRWSDEILIFPLRGQKQNNAPNNPPVTNLNLVSIVLTDILNFGCDLLHPQHFIVVTDSKLSVFCCLYSLFWL